MPLNLLDIVLISSGIIILTSTWLAYRRDRVSRAMFFMFILAGLGLVGFTLFPHILVRIGDIFGLERGADVLVYISIIFLLYTVFILLQRSESSRKELSKLIRTIAVENAKNAKK